jgi:hypothetical protein
MRILLCFRHDCRNQAITLVADHSVVGEMAIFSPTILRAFRLAIYRKLSRRMLNEPNQRHTPLIPGQLFSPRKKSRYAAHREESCL